MSDHLHLIATSEGEYGFSVISPQVPELAYGVERAEELTDIEAVLEFAGAPRLPSVRHSATRAETPEGDEYTVRFANDEWQSARVETAQVLLRALTDDPQRLRMMTVPRALTGEVQFVCVIPGDRLDWVTEQMDDRGDAVVLVLREDEQTVWTLPLAHRGPLGDIPMMPLSEHGLSGKDTVGDLRTAASTDRRPVLV